MNDLPLRARSATEIIDATFQVYKRHALQFILVTGLAYAPWLVIQLAFLRDALDVTPGQVPQFTWSVGLNFLGAFIVFSLMTGVLVQIGSRAYLNNHPGDVTDAIRLVLPKVFRIIGSTIVRTMIMGAGMLLMLFAVPLAMINPALVVLGIIPVFVWVGHFFTRFAITTSVIVLEDASVDKSLSRSSQLTSGRRWPVFGAYVLLFALYLVIMIGITLMVGLSSSFVLRTTVQTVLMIVAYPILALAEMLIYYDLRIRKEGFDIEVLAGTLDTPRQVASS